MLFQTVVEGCCWVLRVSSVNQGWTFGTTNHGCTFDMTPLSWTMDVIAGTTIQFLSSLVTSKEWSHSSVSSNRIWVIGKYVLNISFAFLLVIIAFGSWKQVAAVKSAYISGKRNHRFLSFFVSKAGVFDPPFCFSFYRQLSFFFVPWEFSKDRKQRVGTLSRSFLFFFRIY